MSAFGDVSSLLTMLAFNISLRNYLRDKNPSITFGEYIDDDEECKNVCSFYLIDTAEIMYKNPNGTFTLFTEKDELRRFINNVNADVRAALFDYSSDDPETSYQHINPIAREDHSFNREEERKFKSKQKSLVAMKKTILGRIKSITKKLDSAQRYNYKTKPTFNELDVAVLTLLDSSFVFTNKKPFTLFRGETSLKALEDRIDNNDVINSQYLSCSLDIATATRFNMFRGVHQFDIIFIIVPGTSFFPIYEFSASPFECEILISRFVNIIMEVKNVNKCVDYYGDPDVSPDCSSGNKIQYIFKIIPDTDISQSGGVSPYKKIYDLIVDYEYKNSSKSKKHWKKKR